MTNHIKKTVIAIAITAVLVGLIDVDCANAEQLFTPRGIASDSSGRIIVADTYNHRIQVFDSSGNFLFDFGSLCRLSLGAFLCGDPDKLGPLEPGDGKFSEPEGIAADSSDRIMVADTYNHRIQVFDSSGNFLFKFGSQGSGDGKFSYPSGITVDSSDRIIVADTRNDRIQVFDSSGNFLFKFGSGGSSDGKLRYPRGIAVDSSDRILVADGDYHRVQVFDSSGNFLSNREFESARDVIVDSSDRIIVLSIGQGRRGIVNVFDSSFEFLFQFESVEPLDFPQGITVDSSDRIVVSDTQNGRVQVFDPSGNLLLIFSSPLGGGGRGEVDPGDLNADSTVDIVDLLLVIDIIFQRIVGPPELLDRADVNRDGKINIVDVVTIVRLILSSESTIATTAFDGKSLRSGEVSLQAIQASETGLLNIPLTVKLDGTAAAAVFVINYDSNYLSIAEPVLDKNSSGLNLISESYDGKLVTVIFGAEGRFINAGESNLISVPVYFKGRYIGNGINLETAQFIGVKGEVVELGESSLASPPPLPKVFALKQNYPNPFNPSTTISFELPEGSNTVKVALNIYDVRGTLIRKLLDEEKLAGRYIVVWDGTNDRGEIVSSGVYFYNLRAGDFTSAQDGYPQVMKC